MEGRVASSRLSFLCFRWKVILSSIDGNDDSRGWYIQGLEMTMIWFILSLC